MLKIFFWAAKCRGLLSGTSSAIFSRFSLICGIRTRELQSMTIKWVPVPHVFTTNPAVTSPSITGSSTTTTTTTTTTPTTTTSAITIWPSHFFMPSLKVFFFWSETRNKDLKKKLWGSFFRMTNHPKRRQRRRRRRLRRWHTSTDAGQNVTQTIYRFKTISHILLRRLQLFAFE